MTAEGRPVLPGRIKIQLSVLGPLFNCSHDVPPEMAGGQYFLVSLPAVQQAADYLQKERALRARASR